MFCSKCGKQISDNSYICNYCGEYFSNNIVKESPYKPHSLEVVTISVPPSDEQGTINTYLKMGWTLKSSQGITSIYGHSGTGSGYVSSNVVIKLTFERDRNMPNYDILESYFNKYCILKDKKTELEESIDKHSRKFWLLIILLIAVLFLIYIPFCIALSYVDESDIFYTHPEIDVYSLWFFIYISLMIHFVVSSVIILIALHVDENKKRKKLTPKINDLENKMKYVVNESEKYL